jgi:hypothetical protein
MASAGCTFNSGRSSINAVAVDLQTHWVHEPRPWTSGGRPQTRDHGGIALPRDLLTRSVNGAP